jgi:hypothetical protein
MRLVGSEGIDLNGEPAGRSDQADAFRGEGRPSEARDGDRNFRQLEPHWRMVKTA